MKIPFEVHRQGLFFPAGNFYVDAWEPVPLCLVTHAHGDHAVFGHNKYVAVSESAEVLRYRLGGDLPLQTFPYGEKCKFGQSWVSFHPAGHILGSAQVRIEIGEKVYVISGDYKRAADATCLPYEIVECDLFITESTFALPIYRWEDSDITAKKIYAWWQENQRENHPSVLFCYALGKAQRILSLLKKYADKPIYLHGAIWPLAQIYAEKKIPLAPFLPIMDQMDYSKELILAPPSALSSPWLKRFPSHRKALASGWMQVRGIRKRRGIEKGFVLSDHADWDDLLQTIRDSKASKVGTAHGFASVLAKYLKEEWKIETFELKGLESSDEGEG